MATKKRVRIPPTSMMDAQWVDGKKTLVTKRWTEVSATVAKGLVGSEYNGRPRFEFEDDLVDEAGSEESSSDDT